MQDAVAKDMLDGFMKHVDTSGECWEWAGYKTVSGYGRVSILGVDMRAHRVAYQLHFGRIPDGMYVCHRCDNPSCVRVDHLFLDNHQANMEDMWAKGRQALAPRPGSLNGAARISTDDVAQIRQSYADATASQRELAVRYGISQSHVSRIIRGVNWSDQDLFKEEALA